MVIILRISPKKIKRSNSLRWKLNSTYLLLVIITLLLINVLVINIIFKRNINNRKIETLANANIISNRIKKPLLRNLNYVNIQLLDKTIKNFSRDIGSRVLIMDDEKTVIVDSSDILNNRIMLNQEISSALKGKSTITYYEFENIGNVMYASVPIIDNGVIVGVSFISTSIDDIYLEIDNISKNILIISILCIIFTTIIGNTLANSFTKSIGEFTDAINRMVLGNLNQKIEINTNDEFEKLANSFNIMSTKINQIDVERKNFVANVSHELRTPISSMKLLSESLLLQNESNIEMYKEFLRDINSEASRLNNIITELLLLVSLDKEKLTLNYKITYVNLLLDKIIYRLKPLALKKSIELCYKSEGKFQFSFDVDKIQQAIINILHNAIKYTPENGKVNVHLYSENKDMVIKISDTGIGIPKEHLPFIFDRFYRVDKARARGTGGTGLGLSISAQIVNLHQGIIDVESEVGKGTSFYIKLSKNNI